MRHFDPAVPYHPKTPPASSASIPKTPPKKPAKKAQPVSSPGGSPAAPKPVASVPPAPKPAVSQPPPLPAPVHPPPPVATAAPIPVPAGGQPTMPPMPHPTPMTPGMPPPPKTVAPLHPPLGHPPGAPPVWPYAAQEVCICCLGTGRVDPLRNGLLLSMLNRPPSSSTFKHLFCSAVNPNDMTSIGRASNLIVIELGCSQRSAINRASALVGLNYIGIHDRMASSCKALCSEAIRMICELRRGPLPGKETP